MLVEEREKDSIGTTLVPGRSKDSRVLKYNEGKKLDKTNNAVLTTRTFDTFATSDGALIPGSYLDSDNQRQFNTTVGIKSDILEEMGNLGTVGKGTPDEQYIGYLQNATLTQLSKAYDYFTRNGAPKIQREYADKILMAIIEAINNTDDEELVEKNS